MRGDGCQGLAPARLDWWQLVKGEDDSESAHGPQGVVGWSGYSPGKTVLPLVLTMSSLAFLTGYQLGVTRRQ